MNKHNILLKSITIFAFIALMVGILMLDVDLGFGFLMLDMAIILLSLFWLVTFITINYKGEE